MAGKKNKSKKSSVETLLSPPESESVVSEGDAIAKSNAMQVDGELVEGEEELKVYLPGMSLAEGEELEVDPSAYVMLHELNAEWPCLSFDIVRDGGAEERSDFPMSGYLVTGTQADQCSKNSLYLLRYTNLHKTLVRDDEEEENSQGEDDDSDDDEGDEIQSTLSRKSPRHYGMAIPHDGGVNRIRSNRVAADALDSQQSHLLTASWSDTGKVLVWDLSSAYSELASIDPQQAPPSLAKRSNLKPLAAIGKHRTEGFALAWSPCAASGQQLLSGDCDGQILLTQVGNSSSIRTDDQPFVSHNGSVEDLQWSPTEATVFASSSVDGTVRVWDIRMPRQQAALTSRVHPCDVNVLSWNRLSNSMLATGADDGAFATWDLRTWSPSPEADRATQPLFTHTWHKQAITSIEWSPHDATLLAVSGADDQLTLWDLSIEEGAVGSSELLQGQAIPPQLLFIHQGQQEIKELHWHPQLSGVLLSTALSGFNIFKTISV